MKQTFSQDEEISISPRSTFPHDISRLWNILPKGSKWNGVVCALFQGTCFIFTFHFTATFIAITRFFSVFVLCWLFIFYEPHLSGSWILHFDSSLHGMRGGTLQVVFYNIYVNSTFLKPLTSESNFLLSWRSQFSWIVPYVTWVHVCPMSQRNAL